MWEKDACMSVSRCIILLMLRPTFKSRWGLHSGHTYERGRDFQSSDKSHIAPVNLTDWCSMTFLITIKHIKCEDLIYNINLILLGLELYARLNCNKRNELLYFFFFLKKILPLFVKSLACIRLTPAINL